MDEPPPPGRAALQSMVLPGWGQVSNGKTLKSELCFASYAGFIGWGVSINQDVQDARGNLNAATDPGEVVFWEGEVERLENSRDAKYWLAGLTLLLSMADAYVDAHLRNFDERIDADVGLIPAADGNLLGFRITAPLETSRDRTR
jgi:hypothetical protein